MSKCREFFVTLFIALFTLNLFAATYTWKSGTSGKFATPANWTVEGTDATEEPDEDDDVIIPDGDTAYTVTVDSAIKVGSLVVGDAGGSAVVTVTFNNGLSTNEVVGAVTVGAKGKLTHTAETATGTGISVLTKAKYRLNLKAGGDITIKSEGVVSANACGFPKGSNGPYPGEGNGFKFRGAAHGGIGFRGSKSETYSLNAYGSIRNPNDPGSGGQGGAGGGVIYVSSGGTLTIGGSVMAKATAAGNGSGGSIILKGNAIAGTGSVSVKGGTGSGQTYKGGGGGRIAIYTNESKEFSALGIVPTAEGGVLSGGGNNGSSCGTIYFESANHIPGRGELRIDGKGQSHRNNNSDSKVYKNVTILNTNIRDINEPFGKLVIKDGPQVRVDTGVNLTLTSAISITTSSGSTARIFTLPTNASTGAFAGISIAPPAGTVFTYQGAVTTNHNFTCIAPGATINFAPEASMYIAAHGKFTLAGEPGNLLTLNTTTGADSWTLNFGSPVEASASYVNVSRSTLTGKEISAEGSVGDDWSVAHGWKFLEEIKLGERLTWTGGADTTWVNINNWVDEKNANRAPKDTDVIVIPANCPRYPVIVEDTLVNSLEMEFGATNKLSGANLTVTNSLSCAGAITRVNAGKLVIAGEGDATLDFGDGEYGDVHITKSGGKVVLPNGVKAKRLKIVSSTDTVFEVQAGKTIEADVFDVDGTNGEFENRHLTFASSVPSSYWKLKVNGVMRVRGVNVSDSDASSGREIAAGDFVTGINQNNLNWNFNSESAVEWVGGTDSNWTTPENWLPVGVPGKDAVVSIRPKDANVSVTLSSADLIVPVGGLILGGSSNTATLTCNKAIEVAGSLDVAENTTLVLNSIATNNIVGKDVIVRPSATITHTGPRWGSSQTYGVNLYVKGDMVVEKNAKVNADGKGFATGYGPGRGTGSGDSQTLPSYGGIGQGQEISNSYGSIMCPRSLGSPCASATPGGGQVAITVDGSLIVDGSITSNGGAYGGTGGSIWLTAGALTGSGSIQAKASATKPGDGYYGAAGGRIAIYQTIAETLGFKGGISYAGESSSSKDCSHGTRYYQYAGAQPGGGTIYFNPNVGPGAVLPMAADGNPRTAYSKATVVLEKGTLTLASDVTVYDFNITQTSGTLNLNGHTMRVISRKHKDGKGWTGGNYEERIKGGSIKPGNGGEIIWIGGFSIKVR